MRTIEDMMWNLFYTRHEIACDWHWKYRRAYEIRGLIAEIRGQRKQVQNND